jgi:hypothetical protein
VLLAVAVVLQGISFLFKPFLFKTSLLCKASPRRGMKEKEM